LNENDNDNMIDDGNDNNIDDGNSNMNDDENCNITDEGNYSMYDDNNYNMNDKGYNYNRNDDDNYNRNDNDYNVIDDSRSKCNNRHNNDDYFETDYEAYEYNQNNYTSDGDTKNDVGDHERMPHPCHRSHAMHSLANDESSATAVNSLVVKIMGIDSSQEPMAVPGVEEPCSAPTPCDHPRADGEVYGAVHTPGYSVANILLHCQETREVSSTSRSAGPKHRAHSEPRRKERRAIHSNLYDLHTILYCFTGCAPMTHYNNHLASKTVSLAHQDNLYVPNEQLTDFQANIDTNQKPHHGPWTSVI
jgi:hypothetical protein